VRQRAKAILLSDKGYTLEQIADCRRLSSDAEGLNNQGAVVGRCVLSERHQ